MEYDREQQGILACFTYQPILVKQSLHTLHKLIRRAREVPVEKIAIEKIEIEQFSGALDQHDIDEIHDWSKESNTDENDTSGRLKVQLKIGSTFASTVCDKSDPKGSKNNIRLQVEENFQDPFCPQTIPYELYLSQKKPVIDLVNQEERLIQ